MVHGVCPDHRRGLALLPRCAQAALCQVLSPLRGSPPCRAPLLQAHPSHLDLLSLSSSESLFAAGSLCSASCPHPPSPWPSYCCLTPQFCDLRLLPFSCPRSLSAMLLFPLSSVSSNPFSLLTSVFLPPVMTNIEASLSCRQVLYSGRCCSPWVSLSCAGTIHMQNTPSWSG